MQLPGAPVKGPFVIYTGVGGMFSSPTNLFTRLKP